MNYKHQNFKDIHAEISSYHSTDSVSEFHIIIYITNRMLNFEEQINRLLEAYYQIQQEMPIGTSTVFRRFFLSDAANQAGILNEKLNRFDKSACSIIEQPPLNGSKIALWSYLMTDVKSTKTNSSLHSIKHGDYEHLWLTNAYNKASNSEYQTRLIFNEYIMQLMEESCLLADNCIRTWLFVQDVDNNYAGVVKARNEIFFTQNLTPKTHFIASTGIAGRSNIREAKVSFDAYAVKGIKNSQVKYLYGKTHLNPTYEYGVSFERGSVVEYGDRKHIFISGTASINNKGEIEHINDIKNQVLRMWDNVRVLLSEANADFNDMGLFLIYIRDIGDYDVVQEMFNQHFPITPKLILLAPVCRPGWLIEMECMGTKHYKSDFPCF